MSCSRIVARIFEYDTPLVLHTRSKALGITFRVLQICIGIFILAYYIGYKKGYQTESDTIVSTTTIERKDDLAQDLDQVSESVSFQSLFGGRMPMQGGIGDTGVYMAMKGLGYVTFPVSAVFTFMTENGTCSEDPQVQRADCNVEDDGCVAGRTLYNGNGVMTGRCVPSENPNWPGQHTCEIRGWCPSQPPWLEILQNFDYNSIAFVVENSVYFPAFPEQGRITNYETTTALCWLQGLTHSSEFPLCPIFQMKKIVEEAANDSRSEPFTFEDLKRTGGVILMRILWDCNFDVRFPKDRCSVAYQFQRMDPISDWKFKGPDFTYIRVLPNKPSMARSKVSIKVHAFHLMVTVEGKARKFDVVTLLTRIGASVGLFAFVAIFCEMALMCACCPTERRIKSVKFVEIDQHFMNGKPMPGV